MKSNFPSDVQCGVDDLLGNGGKVSHRLYDLIRSQFNGMSNDASAITTSTTNYSKQVRIRTVSKPKDVFCVLMVILALCKPWLKKAKTTFA